MPKTLDLVGAAETAELLGISRAALADRRKASGHVRGHVIPSHAVPAPFPDPIAELRCGPIWHREQITAYIAARDKRRGNWGHLRRTLEQTARSANDR